MPYTNLNTLKDVLISANGEELESNEFIIGDVIW